MPTGMRWAGRGLVVGLAMTGLVLLGTGVKAMSGGGWELIGWAGVWTYLGAFPTSLFLESATGLGNYAVILIAPSINWALIGFLSGTIVSMLSKE